MKGQILPQIWLAMHWNMSIFMAVCTFWRSCQIFDELKLKCLLRKKHQMKGQQICLSLILSCKLKIKRWISYLI